MKYQPQVPGNIDWVLNLQDTSDFQNIVIEFENKRFILRKWQIERILEKLAVKDLALVVEK